MVAVLDRAQRIEESKAKIVPPFALDESLCFYSPQENLESLRHPRLTAWFAFICQRYVPTLPDAKRRVLLLLPCTKTKPYPLSLEHLRINQALLDSGFRPVAGSRPERELAAALDPAFSLDTVNLAPLTDGRGTIIHRAVISEPIAFVPYEHVLRYEGKDSPSFAYDDPGLFEGRGNAVSPWRSDFTGVAISKTHWRWGDEERRAYVTMHNEMSRLLAEVISRIGSLYTQRIAWVAPGLTHRSFVIGRSERQAHNVPAFKRTVSERLELVGANDRLPAALRLEALPTVGQCQDALARLAAKLGRDSRQVGGIYSRGGGGATPLALPELLETLIGALGAREQAPKAAPLA